MFNVTLDAAGAALIPIMLLGFVFCGVVVTVLIALVIILCTRKKNGKNKWKNK